MKGELLKIKILIKNMNIELTFYANLPTKLDKKMFACHIMFRNFWRENHTLLILALSTVSS